VNKAALMISMCVYVVAGCALFDSAETDSEKVPVAATEPVDENASVALLGAAPEQEARQTPPRTLTRDDIRRLQSSLKEMGFDPGPADGVAGARTRAALSRFQESCSKVKGLIDRPELDLQTSTGNQMVKIPSKQETQEIQSRLRRAGFDPGAIDGVFGKRTRSVLVQIKISCPTASEFAGIFDRPAAQAGKQASSVQTAASGSTKLYTLSGSSGTEAIKKLPPTAAAQSHEEIRILQLRLRDAGFDPGPFDGVMGPKTKLALQQYETNQRSQKTKISLTTRSSVTDQY
jgi:peptidoglycan hydrolase-like protein with peptidoglycan-binding domain